MVLTHPIDGPIINVFVDELWVARMPWSLFQAICTLGGQIDKSDMSRLELRLPACASTKSIGAIITWLQEVIMSPRFSPIPRCDFIFEDLELCRTAGLMGLGDYTRHIFEHYSTAINSLMIDYHQISIIEAMSVAAKNFGLVNDPAEVLYYAVVRRFAYMLLFDSILDRGRHDQFIKTHSMLEAAVRRYASRLKRFCKTYPWPYPEGRYLRAGEITFINPWVSDDATYQYAPVPTPAQFSVIQQPQEYRTAPWNRCVNRSRRLAILGGCVADRYPN
jgi:hypothetical protein